VRPVTRRCLLEGCRAAGQGDKWVSGKKKREEEGRRKEERIDRIAEEVGIRVGDWRRTCLSSERSTEELRMSRAEG
jgi:hypothetical protein